MLHVGLPQGEAMERFWAIGILVVIALAGCRATQVQVREDRTLAKPVVIRSLESVGRISTRRAGGDVAPAPSAPYLRVRVVDVGAALCVVGTTADGHSFLIDAGNFKGTRCAEAVDTLLPADAGLSLVILSHSDSDHLGNLPQILERDVDTLLWTGRVPPKCYPLTAPACPKTYRNAVDAIAKAAARGTTVISLQTTELNSGQVFEIGQAEVTFLAGWHESPWPDLPDSELENAISIVTRVTHGGNALLVTGDAIGRPLDGPDNACEASEA